MEGSRPMFSMMSISPHCGQPAEVTSAPIIQNAGHIPWPAGSFMRASMRPYLTANFDSVLRRAGANVTRAGVRAAVENVPWRLHQKAAPPADGGQRQRLSRPGARRGQARLVREGTAGRALQPSRDTVRLSRADRD